MDDLFAIAAYTTDDTTRDDALQCLERLSVAYHENMELECEDTSEPFKYLCSQVVATQSTLDISYYNRNFAYLTSHGKQLSPTFQHWHSLLSSARQKTAVVISAFHRITRACNSFSNVRHAANQIATELSYLQYPLRILLLAAGRMATADARWATIYGAWQTSRTA